MAAPTDVRVESTSITTATIRWSYAGSNQVGVWRSLTSGSGFVEITVAGSRVAVGTTEYTDTGLSSGTRYFYKLSDDSGSTFSSEVSVVTQTCGVPPALDSDRVLPREGDETVQSSTFNELARRVETGLTRFINPQGGYCDVCITNGAIVVDCITYADCDNVEILVDEDINSISLPNCTNAGKILNFIIPPGETHGIGGWPAGSGFTGDEGFRAPVSGGTDGRTVSAATGLAKASPKSSGSRPGTQRTGSGGGGASGGSGCTCVTNGIGALTIKSCNANNSLDCASTKSLKLIVCGGKGPYTWSNTGSIQRSSSSGSTINVTPPTNSGSGEAGTAYIKFGGECGTAPVTGLCNAVDGAAQPIISISSETHGCNDQVLSACAGAGTTLRTGQCSTSGHNFGGACGVQAVCHTNGTCTYGSCDQRTAGMISAGCNPCGVQAGATVTVTDSVGTQVTIILRA